MEALISTQHADGTPEELVFANKLNYSLRALSGICAQVFGWKAVVFDASGSAAVPFS